MYRCSKISDNSGYVRPSINLRSHNKVKFKKAQKRIYELYGERCEDVGDVASGCAEGDDQG